jgi:hypothetical protein
MVNIVFKLYPAAHSINPDKVKSFINYPDFLSIKFHTSKKILPDVSTTKRLGLYDPAFFD